MPLQATSGAASYDAFGGGVPAVPKYIEDYFSTFLYTDNGSTQTINNGIDLSGKGGMVWAKCRSAVDDHIEWDSARGTSNYLIPNKTNAQATYAATFNSNGVSIPSLSTGQTYTSWSWAKAPKFFDVVTYTGDGVSSRTIAHSLGSAPGCVIIKNITSIGNWCVWHRGNGTTDYTNLSLNLTNASGNVGPGNYPDFTSTTFKPNSVGAANTGAIGNLDGDNYVAYLFAHDAGGFGLTGTDNVISCGSFTTDGGGAYSVTLGYEPQWVMYKQTSGAGGDWLMFDNMRGMPIGSNDAVLRANTSGAETNTFDAINPTATGFYESTGSLGSGRTYIYIAIRRGPMKVPTDATKVFNPLAVNNALNTVNTTGFPIDLQWYGNRDGSSLNITTVDRLRGVSTNTTQQQNYLRTTLTAAEVTTGGSSATKNWGNTGFWTASLQDGANAAYWNFRRAPSFFDEVCYTGAGNGTVISHNLGVEPELAIFKCRSTATRDWVVRAPGTGSDRYVLFTTAAQANASGWYSATSSQITFATSYAGTAESGLTFVAYLFATCAGVSKVGSYTGTGTTKQIDCGFTAGARFVLIKRTDSTGDWYVWDSARGIVAGNDPYLLLNSTAAEVTSTDYVDTYSAGFEISSTAPAAINASGGTFIFLAIA